MTPTELKTLIDKYTDRNSDVVTLATDLLAAQELIQLLEDDQARSEGVIERKQAEIERLRGAQKAAENLVKIVEGIDGDMNYGT